MMPCLQKMALDVLCKRLVTNWLQKGKMEEVTERGEA